MSACPNVPVAGPAPVPGRAWFYLLLVRPALVRPSLQNISPVLLETRLCPYSGRRGHVGRNVLSTWGNSTSPGARNSCGTPNSQPVPVCPRHAGPRVSGGVRGFPMSLCPRAGRSREEQRGKRGPSSVHCAPSRVSPPRGACWGRPVPASGRQREQRVACLGLLPGLPPGKEDTTAPSDRCQPGHLYPGDEAQTGVLPCPLGPRTPSPRERATLGPRGSRAGGLPVAPLAEDG